MFNRCTKFNIRSSNGSLVTVIIPKAKDKDIAITKATYFSKIYYQDSEVCFSLKFFMPLLLLPTV
jgi:hypothetical protein